MQASAMATPRLMLTSAVSPDSASAKPPFRPSAISRYSDRKREICGGISRLDLHRARHHAEHEEQDRGVEEALHRAAVCRSAADGDQLGPALHMARPGALRLQAGLQGLGPGRPQRSARLRPPPIHRRPGACRTATTATHSQHLAAQCRVGDFGEQRVSVGRSIRLLPPQASVAARRAGLRTARAAPAAARSRAGPAACRRAGAAAPPAPSCRGGRRPAASAPRCAPPPAGCCEGSCACIGSAIQRSVASA